MAPPRPGGQFLDDGSIPHGRRRVAFSLVRHGDSFQSPTKAALSDDNLKGTRTALKTQPSSPRTASSSSAASTSVLESSRPRVTSTEDVPSAHHGNSFSSGSSGSIGRTSCAELLSDPSRNTIRGMPPPAPMADGQEQPRIATALHTAAIKQGSGFLQRFAHRYRTELYEPRAADPWSDPMEA